MFNLSNFCCVIIVAKFYTESPETQRLTRGTKHHSVYLKGTQCLLDGNVNFVFNGIYLGKLMESQKRARKVLIFW